MKTSEKILKLKKAIQKNPDNKKILEFLGLLLIDNKKYEEGIPYLEKVISMGNNQEIDYLGLYLGYVGTEQFEKAIKILNEYLENKPAVLFIGTLEDLLKDLQNGYATYYKDTIIKLAEKNKIPIPDNLK